MQKSGHLTQVIHILPAFTSSSSLVFYNVFLRQTCPSIRSLCTRPKDTRSQTKPRRRRTRPLRRSDAGPRRSTGAVSNVSLDKVDTLTDFKCAIRFRDQVKNGLTVYLDDVKKCLASTEQDLEVRLLRVNHCNKNTYWGHCRYADEQSDSPRIPPIHMWRHVRMNSKGRMPVRISTRFLSRRKAHSLLCLIISFLYYVHSPYTSAILCRKMK